MNIENDRMNVVLSLLFKSTSDEIISNLLPFYPGKLFCQQKPFA